MMYLLIAYGLGLLAGFLMHKVLAKTNICKDCPFLLQKHLDNKHAEFIEKSKPANIEQNLYPITHNQDIPVAGQGKTLC